MLCQPVVWKGLERCSAAREHRSVVTRLRLKIEPADTNAAPVSRLCVCLFVCICDWNRIKVWMYVERSFRGEMEVLHIQLLHVLMEAVS